MKTKDVPLTKEECEIIWDALCEATETRETIWADPEMRNKISKLSERFNRIICELE